jgi:DNA-binding MarR family transcriptional regulator
MDADLRTITELDRLIHEPARLLILTILLPLAEADFTYLLRETGLTRGNLSSHLSKLEEAGYIEIEKTFRGKVPLTLCRLTPTGEEAFAAYRQALHTLVHHLPAPARSTQP